MPTVFLSAATVDLRKWRDALHVAFSRVGFRVLTQEHSLSAAPGGVKRLLIEHIDESDCVIHLAGLGYGSDAQDPFPDSPEFVCSWTQFEYYYAHSRNKDVIAFVCAPSLSEPGFAEQGDQTERARRASLQEAHRRRITAGVFDGTPLERKLPRVSHEKVDSEIALMQAFAAAVKALNRAVPEWRRVPDELAKAMMAVVSGVGETKEKLDEIREELRGKVEPPTPPGGNATLRIVWPGSWSHFQIGGTQTIRWAAFAEPTAPIEGFELELYLEQQRVLTICGAAERLAGDARQFTWTAPKGLLDGQQYQIRLLAYHGNGKVSQKDSQPFTLQTYDGLEYLAVVGASLGAFLGFGSGAEYLAPLFYNSIAEDPRYFNDDPFLMVLRPIVGALGESKVKAILALFAAEVLASLFAVAARMMISAPAAIVILTLTAGGGAIGYQLDNQHGIVWGGLLGMVFGASAASEYFRGKEDIEVVLKANADGWKWIGGLFRSGWRYFWRRRS